MKQYDASISFWDNEYQECELIDLNQTTLHVEPTFDACLNLFAQKTKRILDYGCGSGDILFQCADFGYLDYGLGIDLSKVGINYAHKMADLNHYRNLDFLEGGIRCLEQTEDGCFDGIIVSNVLDVVPEDVEQHIFGELTRLLAEDGLMFVKLNPYQTPVWLKKNGLSCLKGNLYEEDGILRLRNLHTQFWRQEFTKHYTIERYLEFPYPWQEGMNRLFLLRKSAKTVSAPKAS